MADGPKKFGRYFLLDLLAQGGMAEIYRARLASNEGANRIIVIKRIQSGYGGNSEFLQMFKSEIKVTMGFNHPNIVQLYDFGEEQAQPYIAMEWVDGKNLRQFLTRFVELKQKFPIDLAVQIIEQSACGLHYAHNFKDKISGESLNIVHRDISPQNLIISYEGTVKVIDFGIAKATVNSEATRAGVIKGKPSYLSPEQINGDVLDGRSDLFSLATVLWELLTGRKLFAGENDLAVLKMIESCNTHVKPPSALNPNVPPELDYIVLKALAKQRDKRYQTVEEFQRVLHKFLYSHAPDFNPGDLAYYAKDMFKNEIVEDRKKIVRLNDEVEHLLLNVVVSQSANETLMLESNSEETHVADETQVSSRPKPTFTLFENPPGPSTQLDIQSPNSRANPNSDLPAALKPVYDQGSQNRNQSQRVSNEPAPLKVINDGMEEALNPRQQAQQPRQSLKRPPRRPQPVEETESGGGLLKFLAVCGLVVGAVSYFGDSLGLPTKAQLLSYLKSSETTRRPAGEGGDGQSDGNSEKEARRSKILMRINLIPGNTTSIKVSGQDVNPDNPVVTVPLDKMLDIVIDRRGYKHYFNQVLIDSSKVGNLGEWVEDISLEPNHYGTLYITTTPSAEATIMVEGKPWVKNTPFDKEVMLPAGTYPVEMVNRGLGMGKRLTVIIEENKAIRLEEHLVITDK